MGSSDPKKLTPISIRMQRIGEWLLEYRTAWSWTQVALAKNLGIDPKMLARIEHAAYIGRGCEGTAGQMHSRKPWNRTLEALKVGLEHDMPVEIVSAIDDLINYHDRILRPRIRRQEAA